MFVSALSLSRGGGGPRRRGARIFPTHSQGQRRKRTKMGPHIMLVASSKRRWKKKECFKGTLALTMLLRKEMAQEKEENILSPSSPVGISREKGGSHHHPSTCHSPPPTTDETPPSSRARRGKTFAQTFFLSAAITSFPPTNNHPAFN